MGSISHLISQLSMAKDVTAKDELALNKTKLMDALHVRYPYFSELELKRVYMNIVGDDECSNEILKWALQYYNFSEVR